MLHASLKFKKCPLQANLCSQFIKNYKLILEPGLLDLQPDALPLNYETDDNNTNFVVVNISSIWYISYIHIYKTLEEVHKGRGVLKVKFTLVYFLYRYRELCTYLYTDKEPISRGSSHLQGGRGVQMGVLTLGRGLAIGSTPTQCLDPHLDPASPL